MDAIDEDEIRSLEQLRGRVYQLYRAFSTLHTDIAAGRMAPERWERDPFWLLLLLLLFSKPFLTLLL